MSHPEDANYFTVSNHRFYRKGRFSLEFLYPFDFNEFRKVQDRSVDLVTFVDFVPGIHIPQCVSSKLHGEQDDAAVLSISTFEDWWNSVESSTRQMVRRARRSGIDVRPVEVDEQFIEDAYQIYNENPTRQGRPYIGYGTTRRSIRQRFYSLLDPQILGAFHDGRMIGFLHLIRGSSAAVVRTLVSFATRRKIAPNNALLAAAVDRSKVLGIRHIVYGKLGWQPGLDQFRRSNGFVSKVVRRYYLPLTSRGVASIRLGLHKEPSMLIPPWIGRQAFSLVDSISTYRAWRKRESDPDFARASAVVSRE